MNRTWQSRLIERGYRILLFAYPASFRRRFAAEMLTVFREEMADERDRRGPWGEGRRGTKTLLVTFAFAMAQRLERVKPHRRRAPFNSARGFSMDALRNDLRHAIRSLFRRPGFALMVTGTLALGIGANAAIFSVLRGVVLRPLPYAGPDRLMVINSMTQSGFTASVSIPNYYDWKNSTRSFEFFGASEPAGSLLQTPDGAEIIPVQRVIGDFFEALGVPAALGGTIPAAQTEPGAEPVVVLSHGFWQRHFVGDPAVVGRSLSLSGRPFTVVGVMPSSFRFPDADAAVYVPLGYFRPAMSWWTDRYTGAGLEIIARLAPGVSTEMAAEDLERVARQVDEQEGRVGDTGNITALADWYVGDVRPQLWLLMGAVSLVLLIACANVANLLLARAEQRQTEMAVRAALGADRRRIIRQLLTESVAYAGTGAVLGLGLAAAGSRVLVATLPSLPPELRDRISLDAGVVGFTVVLAAVTAMVFGLWPAWRTSRTDLRSSLAGGGRGSIGGPHGVARSGLIAAEVALSVVLLVGAGLLVQSLVNLRQVDKGFDEAGVLTFRTPLFGQAYDTREAWHAFHEQLDERLRALPGVQYASYSNVVPLSGRSWERPIQRQGAPEDDRGPSMMYSIIDPEHFDALGVQIVRGRAFTREDREGQPLVAIIDETAAEALFPGEDPIGRMVTLDQNFTVEPAIPLFRTVVGVARHVHHYELRAPSRVEGYTPVRQATNTMFSAYHVVRTSSDPRNLVASVRATVKDMDPLQPVDRIWVMDDLIDAQLTDNRAIQLLVTLFAGFALILAAVGVYGVVSFTTSQRLPELGVRMALGAEPSRVVRLILAGAFRPMIAGAVAGLILTRLLVRLLDSLLFGVSPLEPMVVGSVVALLAAVTVLAALSPALQAMRVDPASVLRD